VPFDLVYNRIRLVFFRSLLEVVLPYDVVLASTEPHLVLLQVPETRLEALRRVLVRLSDGLVLLPIVENDYFAITRHACYLEHLEEGLTISSTSEKLKAMINTPALWVLIGIFPSSSPYLVNSFRS
jgi:hypothetical protein